METPFQHFEMTSRDSQNLNMTITGDDGLPTDLTGTSQIFKATPQSGSYEPVDKVTGDGITVTDAAAGELTVAIAANEIIAPAGELLKWDYSLRVTEGAATISTLRGVIFVDPAPAVPA